MLFNYQPLSRRLLIFHHFEFYRGNVKKVVKIYRPQEEGIWCYLGSLINQNDNNDI